MPRRDFFSFCTTLRPIELKALGELSHVRHLRKGELIYSTGDLAEEVYSVNRGVVEVMKLIPGESDERTFVTRGDIFGVADALGKTAQFTGEAKKITFGRPDYEVTNGLRVIGPDPPEHGAIVVVLKFLEQPANVQE